MSKSNLDLKNSALFAKIRGLCLKTIKDGDEWSADFSFSVGYPRYTVVAPAPYGTAYKDRLHIYPMRTEYAMAVADMIEAEIAKPNGGFKMHLKTMKDNKEIIAGGIYTSTDNQDLVSIHFTGEINIAFPITYDYRWVEFQDTKGVKIDGRRMLNRMAVKNYVELLRSAIKQYEVIYSRDKQDILAPKDK